MNHYSELHEYLTNKGGPEGLVHVAILDDSGEPEYFCCLNVTDPQHGPLILLLLQKIYCRIVEHDVRNHWKESRVREVTPDDLLVNLLHDEAKWLDCDPDQAAVDAGRKIGYDVMEEHQRFTNRFIIG